MYMFIQYTHMSVGIIEIAGCVFNILPIKKFNKQ